MPLSGVPRPSQRGGHRVPCWRPPELSPLPRYRHALPRCQFCQGCQSAELVSVFRLYALYPAASVRACSLARCRWLPCSISLTRGGGGLVVETRDNTDGTLKIFKAEENRRPGEGRLCHDSGSSKSPFLFHFCLSPLPDWTATTMQLWAQGLYTVLISSLNTVCQGGGSNLYPPELDGTFTESEIQDRIYGSKIVV